MKSLKLLTKYHVAEGKVKHISQQKNVYFFLIIYIVSKSTTVRIALAKTRKDKIK